MTLQLLYPKLVDVENESTLAFLCRRAPRPNMKSLGSHTYIIGKTKSQVKQ